jgi:molybdate transport system substrate-binding protein
MRAPVLALALALAMPAFANDVKAFAAGSLRAAMLDAAAEYRAISGRYVTVEFGPSGLLKERLAKGESADVFASANMEHPQALAAEGKSGPVRMFARNRLCALASPAAKATTANLLERMLQPDVKLGTSTPKADPSGDYAWQVFERAEKAKRGSFATLSKKALQLVGGPSSPPPPKDRSAYGMLVANGSADIFLTYCTDAVLAKKEEPALEVITLPDNLAVGAAYGLVVMKGASARGERFAAFLLAPPGQAVFARHGFAPPSP